MKVRTLLIALPSAIAFVLVCVCAKDRDNKQHVSQEPESVSVQKQELAKSIDPMLVNTESDVWYMGGPSGWDKTIIFRPNGSFIFVEDRWGVDEKGVDYELSDTITGSWYTVGNKITIEPADNKSMTQSDTATKPYTVNGETLYIENLYPGEYYRKERD
jgi:hypothetical protein